MIPFYSLQEATKWVSKRAWGPVCIMTGMRVQHEFLDVNGYTFLLGELVPNENTTGN